MAGGSTSARDAVVMLLVGVLLLSLGVVRVWSDVPAPIESSWVHLPPLVLGCLLILGKRRFPLTVLSAGVGVFAVDVWLGGSVAVLLVLLDLVYAAALRAPARALPALWVGVVVTVTGIGLAGFVLLGIQGLLVFGLQALAVLGTPLWWGLSVRRQIELTTLAEQRAADLQHLALFREREVLAEERARMARDLHDAVSGHLSAIAIHAEAALSGPGPVSPDSAVNRSLEAIRTASVQSLHEMRSLIMLLRTGAITEEATAPPRLREAPALVEQLRATGTDVEWDGVGAEDVGDLPSAADHAAYRILQEALTNVAKHAGPGAAHVQLDRTANELQLTVSNQSSAAPVGRGWGLVTMRERAEALGGHLHAGLRGERWVMDVTLPATSDQGPTQAPSGASSGTSVGAET